MTSEMMNHISKLENSRRSGSHGDDHGRPLIKGISSISNKRRLF